MSKLSRSVLKEIVKECIVEVFEESFFPGISNSEMNERVSRKKPAPRRPAQTQMSRSSHLDSISYQDRQPSHRQEFEKTVDRVASSLTQDPIMSDIFKDTAKTTLQEQLSADTKTRAPMVGGDAAAMKASQSDPTELFAESASKWATLAFADSK